MTCLDNFCFIFWGFLAGYCCRSRIDNTNNRVSLDLEPNFRNSEMNVLQSLYSEEIVTADAVVSDDTTNQVNKRNIIIAEPIN